MSTDARDAFAKRIAKIVAPAVAVERGARRMAGLDLSCGRGEVLFEVANRLPETSRIVALCDDREQLDLVHDRLSAVADRQRAIYPRYELVERMPFADGVFDRVWAGLATTSIEPPKTAVRQALRVLRPGGQLVIAAIVRDTLIDFMRLIGNFMSRHEDSARMRPLVLDHTRALDKAGWEDAARRAGAIELDISLQKFDWQLTTPLSQDKVVSDCIAPLGLSGDAKTRAETIGYLDGIVKEPMTLPVTLMRLVCRRGMTEIHG